MSNVGNHQVEQAIYDVFTGDGPARKFAKVDLGGFPTPFFPGLNVAVSSGKFTQISKRSFRQDLTIVLLIAVCNIRSEIERRKIVHPLAEFVRDTLTGRDLGLDLAEIIPVEWDERTSRDQFDRGECVFEVRFATSSTFLRTPTDTTPEQVLESLIGEYQQLQNQADLGTIIGEDNLDLTGSAP